MLCNATFKEYCSLQKHYLPMYRNAKESVNPSPETKRSSLTQEENSVEWRKNGWMLFPEFCFLIQGYIQRCISQGFLMPDVSFLDQWSMIATWVLIDLPLSVRFLMFSFPPFLPCNRFWRRKKTFLYLLWIYPCPSVRNVHMKLQFDWIWPYRLAGPWVSTAILVNLFHFHSRAQCQKWWQNCLRTFPWRLKFSVNLSHIQSSGNFQRNPRVMMGIALK